MNSIVLVLVNSAIAFVLEFASILVIAAIARYAAGYFGSDKASRIAAFGVTLGYVLGHASHSTAVNLEELPAISALIGAIAGLIAAWAWLLRKGAAELIDVDE